MIRRIPAIDQDTLDLLARSALCRGMPAAAAAALARHATIVERLRGEDLYADQADARAAFLIVRGMVKLLRTLASGRDVIIELAGGGDLIGEAALSDDGVYDTRATCVHPTTVLSIPRAELAAFVALHPEAVRNVVSLLHASLRRAHRRVEDMATFGVRQRIARFFVQLADWSGREEDGGIVVPVALSRQEIASLVGTTIETTIRVMTGLRRQGLVQPRRRGVMLPDRAALLALAEADG